jgi:succinate-semialdehyde dehydrogenase/glutarate-semialdehyde dehydrogenase
MNARTSTKTIQQGGRLVLEEQSRSERRLLSSILVDLEPGMEAFDNELFGPVASVIRAKMMPMLWN